MEAADGGMILRDRQGKLWPLQPDQIKKRATDDVPFSLMKPAELRKEILKELNEIKFSKKIDSLEEKVINDFDEKSYSDLIKLKSQVNKE